MSNVCAANASWDTWDRQTRSQFLESLINNVLAEWGCEGINELSFDPTSSDGEWFEPGRRVNINPRCVEPSTQSVANPAENCIVTALHEAGHAIVDCFPEDFQQLDFEFEQLLVESFAWMDYWTLSEECGVPPAESSVLFQIWRARKWIYK